MVTEFKRGEEHGSEADNFEDRNGHKKMPLETCCDGGRWIHNPFHRRASEPLEKFKITSKFLYIISFTNKHWHGMD